MTAVIAYVTKEGTLMISDSCGSNGDTKSSFTQPKCFETGEFKIGFCGSFTLGQSIQHSEKLSKLRKSKSKTIEEHICNKVIPLIKEIITKNSIEAEESEIILCWKQRIFVISCLDFSFLEFINGYALIGQGEDILRGVVEFIGKVQFEKYLRMNLTKVMDIISKCYTGVSYPFMFLE